MQERRGLTCSTFDSLERLLSHVKGNIGFVFTSDDLKDIRDLIVQNKVAVPARAGALFLEMSRFLPEKLERDPGRKVSQV